MAHYGDFLGLLKAHGYRGDTESVPSPSASEGAWEGEGTTILAVRYREGVVIAGDRRATSGTSVIYDRADKVINIDDYSVLAISGSPAIAFEIARMLEHSFQYYRRSQLQELSLEGKLRTLSRLIRDNLPMALQGVGAVIPIFATFDLREGTEGSGKIFFYDAMGARFEFAGFATSGSGSSDIRGALYYLNRWGEKPFTKMTLEEVVALVLRLLDTASEFDAATGGYNRKSNIFPLVKKITRAGTEGVPETYLSEVYNRHVEVHHVG